jgi:predicted membrane chloride channel (bestrophin family)
MNYFLFIICSFLVFSTSNSVFYVRKIIIELIMFVFLSLKKLILNIEKIHKLY